MKSFFKMFLACMTAGIALFFFTILLFVLISALSKEEPSINKNSILTINFNAEIVDRANDDPLGSFDWMTMSSSSKIGVQNLKKALRLAKDNDNIDCAILNFSGFSAAPASLREIRNALLDFKESGKPIYTYGEVYSQKALYLASVADSIFLSKAGMIELSGMSITQAYYAKTFKKLGVEPQIVRGSNNKFKSAVEPYMNEYMSEANRQQLTQMIDDIWNEYKTAIASSRGVSTTQIQNTADEFAVQVPHEALKNGLIDVVCYEDEYQDFLTKKVGAKKYKSIDFVSASTVISATEEEERSKDKIAIIYASGDITSGKSNEGSIGSETIAAAIRKARLNDKVKAIVFRVSSPGGSAMASEVIWRETVLAKNEKPFIVSMGDYAASGGYYISAAADTIVAQPNTITGSIGVFMMLFSGQELLEEKLGIHYETVKNGAFADLGSLHRPLTEQEHTKLQYYVDYTYGDFLQKVATGRNLDSLYVDSIGQGRVWSGIQAQKIGLVDEIGGLNDALEIAAYKAGLDNYRIVEYPKMKSSLDQLMEELTGQSIKSDLLKENLGKHYQHLETIEYLTKSANTVQARLEYDLILN